MLPAGTVRWMFLPLRREHTYSVHCPRKTEMFNVYSSRAVEEHGWKHIFVEERRRYLVVCLGERHASRPPVGHMSGSGRESVQAIVVILHKTRIIDLHMCGDWPCS